MGIPRKTVLAGLAFAVTHNLDARTVHERLDDPGFPISTLAKAWISENLKNVILGSVWIEISDENAIV